MHLLIDKINFKLELLRFNNRYKTSKNIYDIIIKLVRDNPLDLSENYNKKLI